MRVSQTYAPWRSGFNARLFILLVLALSTVSPVAWGKSITIVALGDSLTAGFGLAREASFPHQLELALKRSGFEGQVLNAGVSGDTSAGGLARVGWVLQGGADLVILELGANDGLRGFDPAETKRNLEVMIRRIKAKGAVVLLAGMRALPNLGPEYGDAYNKIFPALAKAHKLPFYPFFLDRVAAVPALNQSDGIHPNAKGVAIIVAGILPVVKRALKNVPLENVQ